MYRNYLKCLKEGKSTKENGLSTTSDNKLAGGDFERDNDLTAGLSGELKNVAVPDYYHHPSDETVQHVYQGSLQIPTLPRVKTVRFFSSSTFTDTAVERNALMTQIYPKLQGFCKSQGYEMQVVDMRWGVRDDMTDDHMTNELCMKELKLCQDVSTGPNFITFLGQKYGYRPFPPKIAAEEFEPMLSCTTDLGDNDLLVEWYLKDENCKPAMYRLQPISSRFPNFVSKDKQLQRASSNAWWEVFERLQVILQKAASKAFTDTDVIHKYYRSVTEEEIYNGILKAPHPNFHTCWFKRTITDAIEHTSERALGRFIDMASGSVNQESQDLLNDLKDKKVPAVLDSHNIIPYDIKWCEDGGVNPDKDPTHKKYLDKFLSDFEAVMSQRIEAAINARSNAEVKEPLFNEVIDHAVLCSDKVKAFHGRSQVLKKIADYVNRSTSGDQIVRPLVVHGVSGSGKTSVIGKAIVEAQDLLEGGTSVIYRFLGTTSDSSTISLLLHSLCKQICFIYGQDASTVPVTYQKLVEAFPNYLSSATGEKPLVIFLDSLDQLSVDDGARRLVWLPCRLPANVKLIVSTLPEDKYECFPQLKLLLPSDEHYVEVPTLPASEASTIVDAWLEMDSKTLQPSQLSYLLEQFSKTPIPLYLRLIYDESMRWRSYSQKHEIFLMETVRKVIANLFERLETKHGFPLVSHAFGLITASKSGVSETEMEDILSCEDEVLNDVYQYWTPPLRRLPPMLFARIRADLGNYLVSRGADGSQVLNWYHRQFTEEVKERYLSDASHRQKVLQNLADYFLGTWANGVKKTFTTKKGEQDSADRHLFSAQPLFFGKAPDKFSERKFNLRKLSELPQCLIALKDVENLKQNVVCNFEFLLAKIQAFSLNVVIDDVKAVEALSNDVEVKTVRETLQLASKAIDRNVAELSSQLIGRLSQMVEKEPAQYKYLSALLDGARCPSLPALIPQSQWLYPPGGQLIHTLPGHSKQVYGMALAKDNKRLITASSDCTLRVWDLEEGKMFRKVDTEKELHSVELSEDDEIAVTSSKSSLNGWRVNTGEMLYEIATPGGPVKFTFAGHNKELIIGLCEKVIRVWDLATGTQKFEFLDEELTNTGGKIAAHRNLYAYFRHETKPFSIFVKSIPDNLLKHTIELKMYCQSMMTTSNGVLIVCVPMQMTLYDLETGDQVMTIGLFDLYQPARLQVTSDGAYLFGAVGDVVKYWDLSTGKEDKICKQSSGIMISNLVSNDLKTVAVSGGDNAIRLYDTSRKDPVISPEYTGSGLNVIGQLYLTPDTQRHSVGTISYNEDFSMCVYDNLTGDRVRKFKGNDVKAVQFVSDTVIFCQTENACYTCNINEGKILNQFPETKGFLVKRPSVVYMLSECMTKMDKYDVNTAQLTSSIPLTLEPGQVADRNGISFEASGAFAIYSVYHDYKTTTCYVLNLASEKCTKILFNTKFSSKIFESPNFVIFPESPKVNVYSLGEDKIVQSFVEEGATVLSFTSSRKLNKLIYSLTNSSVKIYDTNTWQICHNLPTYALDVKLVREDTVLFTSSSFASNSNLFLWDVETGEAIVSLTPDETVSSPLVSSDGKRVTVSIQRTAKPTTFLLHGFGDSADVSKDGNPFGAAIESVINLS